MYDPLRLADFNGVDWEFAEIFEKFIVYLKDKGIKVVFYLPPYHSGMYAKIKSHDNYSGIFDTEAYIRDVAEKYGITVCGSYDPVIAGVSNEDFYDSIHARPEAVQRMLQGVM